VEIKGIGFFSASQIPSNKISNKKEKYLLFLPKPDPNPLLLGQGIPLAKMTPQE
jgi:hypothetical protein